MLFVFQKDLVIECLLHFWYDPHFGRPGALTIIL